VTQSLLVRECPWNEEEDCSNSASPLAPTAATLPHNEHPAASLTATSINRVLALEEKPAEIKLREGQGERVSEAVGKRVVDWMLRAGGACWFERIAMGGGVALREG
jgi:hypothetical protein